MGSGNLLDSKTVPLTRLYWQRHLLQRRYRRCSRRNALCQVPRWRGQVKPPGQCRRHTSTSHFSGEPKASKDAGLDGTRWHSTSFRGKVNHLSWSTHPLESVVQEVSHYMGWLRHLADQVLR